MAHKCTGCKTIIFINKHYCSTKCQLKNCSKINEKNCWEWIGKLDTKGYGVLTRIINGKKKDFRTHRLSYECFKGKIENGLFVCHKCDNKKCLNPDHLFLGNGKDNMSDCKNKGRHRHGMVCGEKAHSAKLNEKDVILIRKSYKNGTLSQIKLSELFKVSQATISAIIRYKKWKYIP